MFKQCKTAMLIKKTSLYSAERSLSIKCIVMCAMIPAKALPYNSSSATYFIII